MHGERDPGVAHAAAFLRDVLALVTLQSADHGLEAVDGRCVIGLPVELDPFAHQPAQRLEGLAVLRVHEEHMRG